MILRKEVPIRGAAGEGAKKVSGQIFGEQTLLDDAITTLKMRIDGLREVLGPVMRTEPCAEAEGRDMTSLALVAEAIRMSRLRIEEIIAEIDHIHDRLELPK